MGLKSRFKFDPQKTLEVLLYIAHNSNDMYNALKVLYFADNNHLEKYGRLISGESYVAMKEGPVPSGAYDIIKTVRGDAIFQLTGLHLEDAFHMDGNFIVPHRKPNMELISESDIECLNAAIEKYGHMPFGQLKQLSHQEKAYQAADPNDFMSFDTIVESLPSGKDLMEYLADK
jgi:uncharacterized phage-associated protein